MEFVARGVEENNGERQTGFVPTPFAGAAITFLWLANGAPEQQGEQGVFRQMPSFAKQMMDEINIGLRHLRKKPMQERLVQ